MNVIYVFRYFQWLLCFIFLSISLFLYEFHDNTDHGTTVKIQPWFVYHGTKLYRGKFLYHGRLMMVVQWYYHGAAMVNHVSR